MKRLVLSAWLAGLVLAGAAPVTAAEDASTEAAAKPGNSDAGKTGSSAAAKLAGAKTQTKTGKAQSKTSVAALRKMPTAVTKTAREAEAIEAVSTTDPSSVPLASATETAEGPASEASSQPQTADASATERPDDATASPDADKKAAEAEPKHMNTGHPQIDALVAIHAKANNVPEALVHRVIVRESKYRKDLVGSCGCIGLMQIKLGTARGLGYTGDAQGLHDPNTNLTYGVKYLAGAYRAANGDHDRAVHYFAKGYYEVAKRQRFAEASAIGRPERVHAPLDITPKLAGLKHVAQAMPAKPAKHAGTAAR
ncbi:MULTISPECIES: lytic transglycosylase domain-containing protein [unclassified Bradyrhizobium]|uniref:lytic transglycosylase domain-containing protein n=1 Tax=unclassified Bradyrhizobium TaxID=2631580 RepID=UPI002916C8B4|nr:MULTISPECIES: lytic transglycosylase domain-containing protein [unclassified Bradyrhizobium]